MTDSGIALERAGGDGLRYVENLLDRAGLPTDDVDTETGRFYVARADGDAVGVGGFEVHGEDGLLRSVAVEESARGAGHGTALVDELEAAARDAGVRRLFLLTTTASDFFAARGYETIDRQDAPATVRNTAEFAELCPSSATAMSKTL
ncbi:arsenic resistance N-acetyltransferase ArsN2 [Halosimplex aquaticum]|uniref:Arsenic resistance N-acetyltransferase ArsN2 n=1 Tax=Halosimplex aquaticum TaxID=3026162 RepID=A0ABD5Y8E3_9EURY|nr:arsenic resistance N-acetyltransferase ArsN2 [Halosimplex aquaticum]